MNHTRLLKCIPALLWIGASLSTTAQETVRARFGINFEPLKDWSREQPLINTMKIARPWISQANGQWDTREKLPMDENGYVTSLQPGQWAGTVLLTEVGTTFPGGRYVFLYDGKGTFEWDMNASRVSKASGREIIEVTPADDNFVHLKITSIDPDDYPRNMRFFREDLEDIADEQLFTPDFLEHWSDADTFRYMEWGLINGNKQESWSDRSLPESRTLWKKGAPLEYMIALANEAEANMWVCIPHLADDDYIRQYAEKVRDELNEDLLAYFEFSNEVWNGMFPQTHWAKKEGQKLGLSPQDWKAGIQFYATQCNRMFKILDEVYKKQPARYKKVVATQAGNVGVTKLILPYEECGENADVLAIAPYITFNVPMEKSRWKPDMPTAAELESWTLDDVFDYLFEKALPEAETWIDQHKDLADEYDLELACYEGGQHLSALGEANRNKVVYKLLQDANRDPRMGDVYTKHLNYWNQIGGGIFCVFNSMHMHSPSGYWGLLEYTGQDPSTAPKYMAVKEWAKKLPSYKK